MFVVRIVFAVVIFFIFFKDWIGLGHILRLLNRIRSGWTRPVGPDGASLGPKKTCLLNGPGLDNG